ncbi:MAG: hypothetical protein ABMB14_32870 [Myxococcota bacterium]
MFDAIRVAAWVSVALVVGMIGVFAVTGIGQDPLQFFHTPEAYGGLLLANPGALRATIGLDDAFLILYSTVFALLAIRIDRPLVRLGCGLMLVVGLLDVIENAHFLAMLAAAEQGIGPGATEIGAQVIESLVKFHVSYAGLLVLGLGLPRDTPAERALAVLSVFVQGPIGVAIHVAPRELAVPLVFARFTYFVVALALVGWAFGRRR